MTPLTPEEAIRRIQERDHFSPLGFRPFEQEQAMIELIREGGMEVVLGDDEQLLFRYPD